MPLLRADLGTPPKGLSQCDNKDKVCLQLPDTPYYIVWLKARSLPHPAQLHLNTCYAGHRVALHEVMDGYAQTVGLLQVHFRHMKIYHAVAHALIAQHMAVIV